MRTSRDTAGFTLLEPLLTFESAAVSQEMTENLLRDHPDLRGLYVAGGGTNAVYVIDTATNAVIETIREQMGRRPWGIAITPDGKKVYTANGLSDSISVIDTECLCVIDSIEAGRGAHSAEMGVIPGGL